MIQNTIEPQYLKLGYLEFPIISKVLHSVYVG